MSAKYKFADILIFSLRRIAVKTSAFSSCFAEDEHIRVSVCNVANQQRCLRFAPEKSGADVKMVNSLFKISRFDRISRPRSDLLCCRQSALETNKHRIFSRQQIDKFRSWRITFNSIRLRKNSDRRIGAV
jgi:hypothetical protein